MTTSDLQVEVVRIVPPRKGGCLASATVEITWRIAGEDHSITVADLRIMQNRHGKLWVAQPSYPVIEGGF